MGVMVEFKGIENLVAAFAKIPEIAAKNMRVAIKEGLQEVEDYARENHKYISRSGNADRAYKTDVDESGLSGTLRLDGEISSAPYVFPLHEGHKAYKVYPVNKKALYWVKDGKEYYSKGHTIPAAPGDPWLYRAMEEKQDDVMEILNKAMADTIKEAGF